MTAEETAQAAELEKYKEQFEAAMDDDFNTADAVSVIYELVRFSNIAVKAGVSKEYAGKIQDMLDHLCGVLGVAPFLTKKRRKSRSLSHSGQKRKRRRILQKQTQSAMNWRQWGLP